MSEHPSDFAVTHPDRPAVIVDDKVVTYAQLEARSNQVANLLGALGVGEGDHVAVLLENRAEFFDVVWGALRIGVYVTPINWHLTAKESTFIVADCGASVLFASSELCPGVSELEDTSVRHRFSVGGVVAGWEDFEAAIAVQPTTSPAQQCEGSWMFYSSGTTGKPKGIKPPFVGDPIGAPRPFTALVAGLYGFTGTSVYLCPAPLYHAAPAGWTNAVHRLGGTAVLMERFDPLDTLALIERHRVTHVQFVPTHLVRLLKLPAEVRAGFDLSSLEVVVHAAAPCPPDVKRAAIDWLGPIVHEYYSGSEGVGFCAIDSEQWLAHPGSVGKSLLGAVHIVGADGREVAAGELGEVWFETPARFEYHDDPEKTAAAYNDRGWSSLGDMGTVDAEGYLYLADRVSNMIISGGVNIYPREVEDVLIGHPAVDDVAVIGVPDQEMGEAVRAVVETTGGADAEARDQLASELIEYCRERLSHFKCPRSVVFVEELPRLPSGKLAKRLLPADVLQA